MLEEMKDLQKLRRRPHGVNIIGLATGEKIHPSTDTDSVRLQPYIQTKCNLNFCCRKICLI